MARNHITFIMPSSKHMSFEKGQTSGDRHGFGDGLHVLIIDAKTGLQEQHWQLDNYQTTLLRGFLGLGNAP
jgi:hypothetical protein